MERDYRLCDKHPGEPIIHCDLCLHEMRLEIRKESADLAEKMRKYRESILGADVVKKRNDEWP